VENGRRRNIIVITTIAQSLFQGREKMPAYWLGAFFNPRGLLALMKQDCIRQFSGDRSGNFEQFVFQTEVTSRDKDHVSTLSIICLEW
jgi:hypothetical protein